MRETPHWSITVLDSATSTSDLARQAASNGAPSGTAFLAIEQTAGRGRRGRPWVSHRGGMYLSVLLRPEIPREQWFGFSFAAALAVSDTVSHFLETRLAAADGPEIGLKWPNDILVGGGKIAGILLEADDNSLVIGSGINIAPLAAVPDVRFAPVSLADFLPSADQLPSPQNVADIYLERLGFWTQNLADGGFGPIRAEWLDRALFRNLRVEIDRQGAVICGLFSGVADDGGMLLLDDSGKTHHITTGDVQFMGG